MTDKLDTKAIRAQYSDGEYLDAYPGEACATILALCDALDEMRSDIETCTAKRDEWADRAMTELGNVLDLRAENQRLRMAAGVVSAVLQSERTRLGGQPFTGNWSIPQIGFRGTVDDALDMADAALAQKGGE